MSGSRHARWWTAVAVSLTSAAVFGGLAGCAGAHSLRSHPLSIVSPEELTFVSPPFTLKWQPTADLPDDVDRYAVFVDRAPIGPGRSIDSVAEPSCRETPGCLDADYLRGLHIYLTASTEVEISALPLKGGLDGRAATPVHQVVVIGLDEHGARVGEFSASAALRSTE